MAISLLLTNPEQVLGTGLSIKPLGEKRVVQNEKKNDDLTQQIFGLKKQTEEILIPYSHEYREKLLMEQDTTFFQDPNLVHLFYGLQKEGRSVITKNIQRVLSYTDLIEEKIEKYAKKTGIKVPIRLIQGLILTESGGDPKIVSRCNAKGLCQFMPGTAKQYGVNVFDPASSIDGAIRKIIEDYRRFQDWTYAISAYHMGPGNVNTIKSIARQHGKDSLDATQLVDPNIPDQLINFLSTKKDDTELYFRKIQSAIWLINSYLSNPQDINENECLTQESIEELSKYVKNLDNLRSTHIMAYNFHKNLSKDSVLLDHACLLGYLSKYVGTELQIEQQPVGSDKYEIETIISAIHNKYPHQGLIIKKPPIRGFNARLDHILKYHVTQGNIWTSQAGQYYYIVPLKEVLV